MALFTKSILAPKEPEDGLRVSVMSRHTLEDGVTPDPRITRESYDEWLFEFAPPFDLVGSYYRKELSWGEYEEAYLAFLRSKEKESQVRSLALWALSRDITVMCIEDIPEHCHRRLLAEECKRLESRLEIVVS